MKNRVFKGFVLSLFFIICGCSLTQDYETQRQIVTAVQDKNFDHAMTLASSPDYYKGEASRMIKYFDLGTLHYLRGEYYQALQNFDKAAALAKEQYTKSVSKMLLGAVGGEAMTQYPTQRYELSLLRFYTSLTHYKLYQTGKYESYTVADENAPDQKRVIDEKKLNNTEKRMHFNAARATVLDWDSLLSTFSNELSGKKTFKRDMLAKTWGGFMHDVYGTSADKQISKQLYRDVDKVLLQNYNLYPSYNALSEKYSDNYKKMPTLPVEKIKKDYVSETALAKELVAYAAASEKKLFAADAKKDNVRLVLKTGMIVPKKEETVSFTVPWEILLFAHADDNGFRNFITLALAGEKIEFKIPSIDAPKVSDGYEISFKKKDSDKVVAAKKAVLVEPVSEIAYYEYAQERPSLIAAKGAKIGAEYAVALWTAYQLWNENDFMQQLAAYASFKAASATIKAADSVDLRYWSLLPENIWQQSFSLPKGTYIMTVLRNNTPVHSQQLDIKDKNVVFWDIDITRE